jgi:hypothetical protein
MEKIRTITLEVKTFQQAKKLEDFRSGDRLFFSIPAKGIGRFDVEKYKRFTMELRKNGFVPFQIEAEVEYLNSFMAIFGKILKQEKCEGHHPQYQKMVLLEFNGKIYLGKIWDEEEDKRGRIVTQRNGWFYNSGDREKLESREVRKLIPELTDDEIIEALRNGDELRKKIIDAAYHSITRLWKK